MLFKHKSSFLLIVNLDSEAITCLSRLKRSRCSVAYSANLPKISMESGESGESGARVFSPRRDRHGMHQEEPEEPLTGARTPVTCRVHAG